MYAVSKCIPVPTSHRPLGWVGTYCIHIMPHRNDWHTNRRANTGLHESASQARGLAAAAIAASKATPSTSNSVGEGLDGLGDINLRTAQVGI